MYYNGECEVLKTLIFPSMRDDDVFRAISYDKLLILFANKLCQKYRSNHLGNYIRQILRALGRLLVTIKKN